MFRQLDMILNDGKFNPFNPLVCEVAASILEFVLVH